MDVRCESCDSVYEFDDARVPDSGLSVKCSRCGQVFRVFRPGGTFGGGGEWRVRQAGGNVLSFRELTTLQRWIVERKVTRDDEISKTGKQWKRLGNIGELATFFQVLDAQPQGPTAAAPSPGYGSGPQAAFGSLPQYAPGGAAWEQTAQPAAWNDASGNRQRGGSAPTPAADDGEGTDDLDDDFTPRRSGMGKWVFLILVLGAGGLAGAYFYKPALFKDFLHRVDELALNHVKTGYAELYRDSSASIDRAADNFEKAISIDPRYAEARAGHAEAELARAEYLAEEAAELAATGAQLPEAERAAATAKVDSLRRESIQRGERAFNAAKEALRLDPELVAGSRAMADYYRFNTAPDSMRPLIERARAKAPKDAGVAYVLGSSVANDAAARDRAVRYFDEALEAAPDMQRARYKLARVYQAQGEKDKALLQVETLLKAVPEHERAQVLLAQLKPPAPAPMAADEKKPLSFEQLVAQAERLRMSDQPEKALALYERASNLEPDDPDVLTGMGWCYVDLEEAAPAIVSFKEALELAPRLTEAHMGLAEAYRMKGDKASAVKHYKAYLDILPTGAEAPVARRMIETLEKK